MRRPAQLEAALHLPCQLGARFEPANPTPPSTPARRGLRGLSPTDALRAAAAFQLPVHRRSSTAQQHRHPLRLRPRIRTRPDHNALIS